MSLQQADPREAMKPAGLPTIPPESGKKDGGQSSVSYLARISAGADAIAADVVARTVTHEARTRLLVGGGGCM